MEESMSLQLRELREEQQRLEQLLGHTALGTSAEASALLRGNAQAFAQQQPQQQRGVRELSVHEVNSAAGIAGTGTLQLNAPATTGGAHISATKSNQADRTDAGASSLAQRTQWTYQDRLQELEALKKKYEHYARTSMSQYFNSVGDFEGYKERRASRMQHVQPFTFESRELVKPPRIREQRAEADRQSREAALEERRRHPLKAKPVPPSTFMNKYELMVEEWCQRKAAIELMSRERARLAKEEAEFVRLSAQSLRKTREELMGVVYGPDGNVITRSEQQRRRAQSADARGGVGGVYGSGKPHSHQASEVPLEVKMKLWPALSDHERVRKERILYRAALRKVEVDEEVRQVLPLLTSPTPTRCYDAAAGVNPALLLAVSSAPGAGGPCFGVGQAIHPPPASVVPASAQVGVGAGSVLAGAAPLAASAAVPTTSAPPTSQMVAPLPPPSSAVPPPLTTTTAAVPPPTAPAPAPAPAPPLPPPPASTGAAASSPSPAPHQSLSLLSTSTVSTPPLGVGGATGGSPAVPPPPPPVTAVPVPAPLSSGGASGVPVVSSGSSPSPLLSVVPSSVGSPASPLPPLPPPAGVPPPPQPAPPLQSSSTTANTTTTTTAMTPAPPVPPPSAAAPTTTTTTTAPAGAVPPPPPPSSTLPLTATTTTIAASTTGGPLNAGSPAAATGAATPAAPVATSVHATAVPSITATATAVTASAGPASVQQGEDKEALWRRYNPQLTFRPHVKPGVPNFEALWAKNKVELAEKKKAQPTTTTKPFDLTPSAKAEKVVGRRPTRSIGPLAPPARQRSASRGKKPSAAAEVAGASSTAKRVNSSARETTTTSPPPSLNDTRPPQPAKSTAPRGTRAHALRTEAIYSSYVKQSEEHNKVTEADEQYWRAVAQRQREVRQRLAGYLTDHHVEHEQTIRAKVRALRASMKESEAAAEARLAEMKQRVAEMPPVFAEPVHLHEESKARAEAEQSILQSLKDTGLDGATIKNILATSAAKTSTAEDVDAAAGTVEADAAKDDMKTAVGEGGGEAPHSTTSDTKAKGSRQGSNKGSHDDSSSSSSGSSSSDGSDSDTDSDSSSGSSSGSSDTGGGAGSHKKDSSAPPRSASMSVPSTGSVPVPKPVTPKKEVEYSDDSFEDSSDND